MSTQIVAAQLRSRHFTLPTKLAQHILSQVTPAIC
jgi:hypothetical protein